MNPEFENPKKKGTGLGLSIRFSMFEHFYLSFLPLPIKCARAETGELTEGSYSKSLRNSLSLRLFCNPHIQGKFRPKRGGVNCKGRDYRVEKMANIGILVLRRVPLQFTWNTVVD